MVVPISGIHQSQTHPSQHSSSQIQQFLILSLPLFFLLPSRPNMHTLNTAYSRTTPHTEYRTKHTFYEHTTLIRPHGGTVLGTGSNTKRERTELLGHNLSNLTCPCSRDHQNEAQYHCLPFTGTSKEDTKTTTHLNWIL